jgi:hypothetical protein
VSLGHIATTIHDFMNAGPGTIWGLVCITLVGIPVTLLHELGHAVVASARLGSDVRITVGNVGRVGTVRVGRLTATLNAFQLPTRLGGRARFDARRATAPDMLWISLAGPAASLAGGLLADIAYRRAPASGVLHALLWAAVFDSVFAVANLIPLRLRERRGGPAFKTDGMVALSALAMISRGRSRSSVAPQSPVRTTADSPVHGRSEPTQVGVRVWRHDDHLHVGVGTRQAFDARTAAVTTISPAKAREMARAILELAAEAEQPRPAQPIATPAQPIATPAQPIATPAQPIATPAPPRTTEVADRSVAPPGYTN